MNYMSSSRRVDTTDVTALGSDWHQGQKFGLGLEFLASALSDWPRLTSLVVH